MRNVADTGLNILYTMLQNVTQDDTAAQSFYSTYYTDILQHIFSVVTDSSHTAGKGSLGYICNVSKVTIKTRKSSCVNARGIPPAV